MFIPSSYGCFFFTPKLKKEVCSLTKKLQTVSELTDQTMVSVKRAAPS